eukprot:scaffold76680_cov40-Phaeocystis_antarctica.AAC.1
MAPARRATAHRLLAGSRLSPPALAGKPACATARRAPLTKLTAARRAPTAVPVAPPHVEPARHPPTSA